MKESYYFQHDYEPTSDPKISALLAEYGAEGYGIFWRTIEMLHSNTDHKIPKKKYIFIAIAKQLLTSADKIIEVIDYATNVCELFLDDKDFIISQRVLNNFKKRDSISEKRSEAGKRSASVRYGVVNNTCSTKNSFVQQNSTKGYKGKEKTKKKSTLPFGEFNPGEFTGLPDGMVL